MEDAGKETKKEETSENDGDKVYKIGICQQLEHQALDAATEGFKAALEEKLGDKVKFDYQKGRVYGFKGLL